MKISLSVFIIILVISGCASPSDLMEIELTPSLEIPTSVTGRDRDLWPVYVNLINSLDCQLPCWWMLEIDQTTRDEVINFLQGAEFSRTQARSVYPDAPLRDIISADGLGLDFLDDSDNTLVSEIYYNFSFNDSDILSGIHATIRNPNMWLPEDLNPFLIQKLFTEIEHIPVILVASPEHAWIHRYTLLIIYPEHLFQIRYSFDFSAFPIVCITSENILELRLSIVNNADDLIQANIRSLIPIEEGNSRRICGIFPGTPG